jgi:hypothetical protein
VPAISICPTCANAPAGGAHNRDAKTSRQAQCCIVNISLNVVRAVTRRVEGDAFARSPRRPLRKFKRSKHEWDTLRQPSPRDDTAVGCGESTESPARRNSRANYVLNESSLMALRIALLGTGGGPDVATRHSRCGAAVWWRPARIS